MKFIITIDPRGETITPFTDDNDWFTKYNSVKSELYRIKDIIKGLIEENQNALQTHKSSGLSSQALISEGKLGALLELKEAIESWGFSFDEEGCQI